MFVRALRMSSSYAAWKRGEVEGVGVLDVRDEQRAGAVGLLHVDREAEVDVLVAHDRGLAVDDAEATSSWPAPTASARSTA